MTRLSALTESHRLEVRPGIQIALDQLPGKGPGLLFMHGFASQRWGEKSSALARYAHAHGRPFSAFDFHGHGDSDGNLPDITLTNLIGDGEAALRHVGKSILVGTSMGGLVAAWVAARNKGLVGGLVLLAPALGFIQTLKQTDLHQSSHFGSSGALRPNIIDDAIQWDESKLPESIEASVLLVHGTLDDRIPVRESEDFFAKIPHDRKKLWVVDGGDHQLHSCIDEVCRMTGDWLLRDARDT